MKEPQGRAAPRDRWIFAGLLALSLVLRLADQAWGSLKLDDFHSLYHARTHGFAELVRSLGADNHPPLSFLLLKLSCTLFGESEWALRLPALVAGIGTLVLVWRIGRRLPSAAGRAAGLGLLAVSSLHMELSSDVRMYALLALASAGLLDALLDVFEEGRGHWRLALWTCVGLHTHYHFLYLLVLLGGAALVLALRTQAYRARLGSLCAGLGLGIAAAAPWYLLVFPEQLGHGLPPGGSNATPQRLAEGMMHLVFLNISIAGPLARSLWLAAGVLVLVLAASGAWTLGCGARRTMCPALPVLLTLGAFGVPLLATVAAALASRAGFEWRYLAGSLPAFCLLAGAEAGAEGPLSRLRQGAAALVLCAALALALWNARDPGEEDYRGAIGTILAHRVANEAVLAADWQPKLFPHALAWDYYAPRLARGPLPPRLEFTEDFSLLRPDELANYARVSCCLRSLPNECGILRTLRRTFPHEAVQVFGRSVYVHVFTRE